MRPPHQSRRGSSGFTLIEVMLALLILALTLGVIYESLGASLRRSASLRQRELAWLVAQSTLSEIRARETLTASTLQGSDARGLRWQAQVRPLPGEGTPAAFEVVIRVAWGARAAQQVRLQSIEVPGVLP